MERNASLHLAENRQPFLRDKKASDFSRDGLVAIEEKAEMIARP